ncbi:MAG TPA: energy transducer TonB [Gemmatimonadaceae bacterium]
MAREALAAVEGDLAKRLAMVRPGATARYLVTLRASCVREFPGERPTALTRGDAAVARIRTEGVPFPYPGYLNNVARQIELRFDPSSRDSRLRAEVGFLVHRDGSITNIRFLLRSGVYAYDAEAQGAVEAAANAHVFGPLPAGFTDEVVPIVLTLGDLSVAPVKAATEGAYFEFQVEKTALAASGNPPPTYPAMLKSAGVGGHVLAQFVVDASGKPDMSTFRVLESSHELFSAAVREAVAQWHYFPAEIGGEKVSQVVQQPFGFAVP